MNEWIFNVYNMNQWRNGTILYDLITVLKINLFISLFPIPSRNDCSCPRSNICSTCSTWKGRLELDQRPIGNFRQLTATIVLCSCKFKFFITLKFTICKQQKEQYTKQNIYNATHSGGQDKIIFFSAYTYMPYLTQWDKISQNSDHLKVSSQKNFQISQNF